MKTTFIEWATVGLAVLIVAAHIAVVGLVIYVAYLLCFDADTQHAVGGWIRSVVDAFSGGFEEGN